MLIFLSCFPVNSKEMKKSSDLHSLYFMASVSFFKIKYVSKDIAEHSRRIRKISLVFVLNVLHSLRKETMRIYSLA